MQNQEALVTDPKFLSEEYLSSLHLRGGAGSGQEGDCCALQERRRWSGLDSKSYEVPETDSQVCGSFMVRFQDAIKDQEVRDRLIPPLIVKLVGSAGSKALEQRRSWLAVDWALREVAPAYFDMSPELATHAEALRALPPINSRAAAAQAYAVRDAARAAAWELRQNRLAEFRTALRIELEKLPKPVTVAAAAAAAVEAVEAVAAVAAVEAVVEAVVEAGSDRYWQIRYAVRDALVKHFREDMGERLKVAQLASWESGAKCLERMLDLKEESEAA